MRHAPGYEDYRRATDTDKHRVGGLWQDSKGKWHCACSYPVVGVKQLTMRYKPAIIR